MNVDCKSARRSMWDLASGALPETERTELSDHLGECHDCTLHHLEAKSLRTGLRHLPVRQVPVMLTTRLRVRASKELRRANVRRSWRSRVGDIGWRVALMFDHLLKPFAVPAAGGLLASLLCFGIIVDTLHVPPSLEADVPVGLYTEVMIDEMTPFSFHGRDVMLQLTVDSQGQVTDFEVMQAEGSSVEEVRDIGNFLMFSTFTPATRFGQRITSKRLFAIRHMAIKG
ncbi:MAG: putative transrane anti-sigma factor [Bryobacterales bacterium]|nr:putative transrane anti-sigma factor [Bryobacterales bacterium]